MREQRLKTYNQEAEHQQNEFPPRIVLSEQRLKTYNQEAGQTLQAMSGND